MANRSGFMGGMYAVSEWISRFTLGNLLWALFNLPVGLLLLSLLNLQDSGLIFYIMAPLVLITPFVFFPATTALFAKAREWVRKDENDLVENSYIYYYKENYLKSLGGGIVFVVLWTVLAADVYYFSTRNTFLMNAFLIMGILLFVWTINFFAVMAHYDMKLKGFLKQSFFITIGSPLLFLTIVISSAIVLYISLYIFPLLIPIVTGSLIAFLSFSAFYRLHLKIVNNKK
ncbi:hypothetical protein GCM10010954_32210 [Halobacillus andaensis]|uniref:DUF624 domain-containing protein n=1 Tax=Halobacillus andaensis TaxID=1176239 RepID=A0A917BA82_HALAA|nr:DUF624 domain-containing protein [Halobacillus andaensis]MBP2005327.1 putative membrane protein YesL [Halobacillus andaensis]GGF30611.1 hypothetical protein GCM10010954_32210 [Halobacillus andaensis]